MRYNTMENPHVKHLCAKPGKMQVSLVQEPMVGEHDAAYVSSGVDSALGRRVRQLVCLKTFQ